MNAKNIISVKLAGHILMISMAGLIIVHLLVLFRVIPYQMVWGGQIKDASSLLLFETIALIVTVLFLITVALRTGCIRTQRLKKAARVGMWIMFVYFLLNTIGNLASNAATETIVFTPITLALSLLSLRLAIGHAATKLP